MSDETIEKVADYINHVKKQYKNYEFLVVVYGGEPLLYTDIIEKLFLKTKLKLGIITNGILIDKKIDWIKHFNKETNNKLRFSVSYDYFLQDNHRMEHTYDIIRNNILLLDENNIPFDTITVFPKGDIPLFYDTYMDYIDLKNKLINNKIEFKFNIDRANVSNTVFDEIESRKAFEKVKEYIEKNNAYDTIRYNTEENTFRKKKEYNCIWRNVFCAFDINGDMYPACNAVWEPDNILDIIRLGNVYEDFSVLDKKRYDLLVKFLKYKTPQKCIECKAVCRILPWRTIKNDISEFNGMPEEDVCKIQKIISEYFNYG